MPADHCTDLAVYRAEYDNVTLSPRGCRGQDWVLGSRVRMEWIVHGRNRERPRERVVECFKPCDPAFPLSGVRTLR